MELEELRVAVSTGEIDSVVVGFTDHYGRTMGKRFDADSVSYTHLTLPTICSV